MNAQANVARLQEQARANRTLLMKLGAIVVGMFGFGYALVPFYDKICEAAGLRTMTFSKERRTSRRYSSEPSP